MPTSYFENATGLVKKYWLTSSIFEERSLNSTIILFIELSFDIKDLFLGGENLIFLSIVTLIFLSIS